MGNLYLETGFVEMQENHAQLVRDEERKRHPLAFARKPGLVGEPGLPDTVQFPLGTILFRWRSYLSIEEVHWHAGILCKPFRFVLLFWSRLSWLNFNITGGKSLFFLVSKVKIRKIIRPTNAIPFRFIAIGETKHFEKDSPTRFEPAPK